MAARRLVITLDLTPNAHDRSPSASVSSDCSAPREHSESRFLQTHAKPRSMLWAPNTPLRSLAGHVDTLCVSGLMHHHTIPTGHAARQGAAACAHICCNDSAGVRIVERGQNAARVAVVVHVVMQAPCSQPRASAHAMQCTLQPHEAGMPRKVLLLVRRKLLQGEQLHVGPLSSSTQHSTAGARQRRVESATKRVAYLAAQTTHPSCSAPSGSRCVLPRPR